MSKFLYALFLTAALALAAAAQTRRATQTRSLTLPVLMCALADSLSV